MIEKAVHGVNAKSIPFILLMPEVMGYFFSTKNGFQLKTLCPADIFEKTPPQLCCYPSNSGELGDKKCLLFQGSLPGAISSNFTGVALQIFLKMC
jgi:hypothetical protein